MRSGLPIGAVATIAILASAGQAAALSCAAHPDASPASIVAGTEELATGKPFFEQYDLAIIGTPVPPKAVPEKAVPAPVPLPPYRATTFRVDAAFGVDTIDPSIVVTTGFPLLPPVTPDFAGAFAFESDPAKTWFVPLRTQGPDGLRNHSGPCDPISVVDRAEIPDLIAGARPGLPVALPGESPPPPPPPPPPGGTTLAVTKSAPAIAQTGSLLTYEIVVRNRGAEPARGVALIDRLPRGVTLLRRPTGHPKVRARYAAYRRALRRYRLAAPDSRRAAYRRMITVRSAMRRVRFGSRYLPRRSGASVALRVGTLAPGRARTVRLTVRVRARAGATLSNVARARASNAAVVSDSALTRVVPAPRR